MVERRRVDSRDINVARAIVSCHETSPPTPRPNYGQLARLPDGPANGLQVTFGAHQATDASNSLDRILTEFRRLAIEKYGPDWEGHTLADELAIYLPVMARNTRASCIELANDQEFLKLLKGSADEPLMREAQNTVFDVHYMTPAIEAVEGSGWVEPLSLAVVYDSMIHGGWKRLRDKVHEQTEHQWIRSYIGVRHFHMANAGRKKGSIFGNPLLRNTTYRMRTFSTLVAEGNWKLLTPIRTGNGAIVNESDVDAWRTE